MASGYVILAALVVAALVLVAVFGKKTCRVDADCATGTVCVGGACAAPPLAPPGPPATVTVVSTDVRPDFSGVFSFSRVDPDGYPIYTGPGSYTYMLYRNPAAKSWVVSGKHDVNGAGECCTADGVQASGAYAAEGQGPTDAVWSANTVVSL